MCKSVGVVLDVSLRHIDGKRLIDQIKECLIEYVRNLQRHIDFFYLYDSDITTLSDETGQQVSSIANYESDGSSTNVVLGLKQAMYVIATADYCQRYLVLITDRSVNSYTLKKIAMLNELDQLECSLLAIQFGQPTDSSYFSIRRARDAQEMLTQLKDMT